MRIVVREGHEKFLRRSQDRKRKDSVARMQKVEEDTYVSHFPAELFPGWQLRHPRPHVRQREEGQLDKAGCLLRCLIILYSHCTLLSRREIKALLGDRKQSAMYLFLLNTRMSIRMQDLKP